MFFTNNNFISVILAIVNEAAKRSNALNFDKDIFRGINCIKFSLKIEHFCSGMKLGGGKVSQGAEERSSLLSKLLFSRYTGSHKVSYTTQQAPLLTIHWQP
jgi:hypothetical protein